MYIQTVQSQADICTVGAARPQLEVTCVIHFQPEIKNEPNVI